MGKAPGVDPLPGSCGIAEPALGPRRGGETGRPFDVSGRTAFATGASRSHDAVILRWLAGWAYQFQDLNGITRRYRALANKAEPKRFLEAHRARAIPKRLAKKTDVSRPRPRTSNVRVDYGRLVAASD